MSSSDRRLGLDRDITRRDFLNGIALAAGALGWSPLLGAAQDAPSALPEPYPPRRMGMRGSHPGSYEAAHQFRDHPQLDPASVRASGESYDLVVVGAGLSGLAAAHFFQKRLGERARVLILDNHDDFGGHAKRNELELDGRWVVLNGGTLEIESPSRYNEWAARLLTEIGVDLDRYRRANAANTTLYASHGLRPAYFFDRETFGVDRLVAAPAAGGAEGAVASPQLSAEWVRRMPISETAKRDLLRLQDPNQPDYLPGLSSARKKERLARMSYEDYLLNIARVDRQAAWFYSALGRDVFGVGADATPALFAWQMQDGEGGFAGLKLEPAPDGLLEDLPGGQHGRQRESEETVHFPDGNATLARLLVRRLIPEAVPGGTQEDVGTARVAYERLDRAGQPTRIRLESTVLNVCHDGARQSAGEVVVSYARGGALESVRARACVLACWHMFIPYLVPDLPAAQKEALAHNVKAPIVYSNVFLRNWRAFDKLGVSRIDCPTMYHDTIALAEAADLGALRHPRSPDEPIALRLTRMPGAPGRPRKEQHRLGRAELLATSFETFERRIREQLLRVLGPGGFDPARDIAAIAVNRWPHGYSYTYNSLYDPLEWVFTESSERPCVTARQPFGLISIANADAAASPHTDAAIGEAHRAVTEVLDRRAYPFART